MSGNELQIKLVCVGDGGIGKTSLLMVYRDKVFPEAYVPTVFENYRCKVTVEGQEISVQMWDTAGQEELENIRTLSYSSTDIFMVCFAVNERSSYDNIPSKWLDEMLEHVSSPVMMIIGLKTDLRDSDPGCLSPEDGKALAQQVGAVDYCECSAKNNVGVKEVFDKAILSAYERRTKGSGSNGCCEIQ